MRPPAALPVFHPHRAGAAVSSNPNSPDHAGADQPGPEAEGMADVGQVSSGAGEQSGVGDQSDVRGQAGTDSDLFQKVEPRAEPQKSTLLLWQFFLLPLLIVIAAVGVFLLFGAFAGTDDGPEALLQAVLEGGDNEKRQAAHQLAIVINDEYRRVSRGERSDEPPFYGERTFRARLRKALEGALGTRESPEHQELLAKMVGLIGDEQSIPSLSRALYPKGGGASYDDNVRRGAAQGLLFLAHPGTLPLLARAAQDEADGQVRILALSALANIGLVGDLDPSEEPPAVLMALRKGLSETAEAQSGARVNAAVGLAVRGIGGDDVLEVLGASLSREGLAAMKVPPQFHAQALRNASRAAARLGDRGLRANVERLTSIETEGDSGVRQIAREALKRWRPAASTPDQDGDGVGAAPAAGAEKE